MTVPKLIQLVTKTLNTTSAIKALVGMRIYPQSLALISDPSFPCITISYEPGSQAGNMRTARNDVFLIQVWSKTNFTKCYDIYEQISLALSEQRLQDTNYNVFLYEDMGAIQDIDDSGKDDIYSVSCRYAIYNARR